MAGIVVVGASLAGVQAAQVIRKSGYEAPVVLVGDEPHQPYDRPPLSKQYLTSDYDDEKLLLRPTADPEALGLTWRLGRRAVDADTANQTVTLGDGEVLAYDGLVVATGASPRRLWPDRDPIDGVHVLRNLDDARAIKSALAAGPTRVVVCGAGFIGAEVAASARELGLDVTLVDVASAPLDRVLDPVAGMAVAELHRSNGVEVRLGVGVAEPFVAEGTNRLAAVELTDGTRIDTEVLIVGIGVVPNTGWLDTTNLHLDDGVVTDATCLAAPNVVAAGDIARWPNERFGGAMMRVEQWDNAIDQGGYAAKRLLAEIAPELGTASEEPFAPIPWFWSDQFDRKIQLAGLTDGRAELLQGTIEARQFVQAYVDDDDEVRGILCWNRPRQAILGRQLIADRESLATARERLG